MSNKVSLKNPKDQNFEVHTSRVLNLLEKQAQKLFKDKPFHEEFKGVFVVSSILKYTSNIVSFCTAFIAIQVATNLLFGYYLSSFVALSVCSCIEVAKMFFWSINSKWILKYKKVSKPILGVLFGLHLISLGLSAYGGWVLPELLPKQELLSIAAPNFDSIQKPFLAAIAKIDGQAERTSLKAASITSHSTIKSLNAVSKTLLKQKQEQETLKNRAISEAKAEYREKRAQIIEKGKKGQENRKEWIFISRLSCAFASVFFELLMIVCGCFGVYYLFRLNIELEAAKTADSSPSKRHAETSQENPTNTDVLPSKRHAKTPPPSEQLQEQLTGQPNEQPKGQPIGFFFDKVDLPKEVERLNVKTCHLSSCENSFTSLVHNKKYCSDECKKLAYQKRRYSRTQKSNK